MSLKTKKVIQKGEVLTLNTKDSENFFSSLTVPIKFNDKISIALKEHDERVVDVKVNPPK